MDNQKSRKRDKKQSRHQGIKWQNNVALFSILYIDKITCEVKDA